MADNDGFASENARDLHNHMLQVEEIRVTAKLGLVTLSSSVLNTLHSATDTIEKLAIQPLDCEQRDTVDATNQLDLLKSVNNAIVNPVAQLTLLAKEISEDAYKKLEQNNKDEEAINVFRDIELI